MFSENRDVCEVTWENMAQTDRQAGSREQNNEAEERCDLLAGLLRQVQRFAAIKCLIFLLLNNNG
jgi:hypothetical protein